MKQLNKAQKSILFTLAEHHKISPIRLRSKLIIPVADFIEALTILAEAGLIIFDKSMISITSLGIKRIHEYPGKSHSKTAHSNYINSISVPPLSSSDFYLPNRKKFLASILKGE